ncbi:MAG: hypothetical protein KAR76_00305 [Methanosarcinales archaeon]|nr:hypothetical protein [Methanosarcinales archaeon]
MRKRIYHRFPVQEIEFTQTYSFRGNLQYLVKTLAGMNNKSGSITLKRTPDHTLEVKRKINVYITEAGVDFKPLILQDLDIVLDGIEDNGILDFKISILYSRLDKDYRRVSFNEDTFLIRCDLAQEILTMKINPLNGPGHTNCNEVASTLVDEIERGQTK